MTIVGRRRYVEIDVEPLKEYHLIAATWGPGVADQFWISAAARDLEIKCLQCSTPPSEEAARAMATKPGAAGGPSALCVMCKKGPITGTYFELEEGQCHSECHEEYSRQRKQATAPTCAHCQQRILEDGWSVFKGADGSKTNIHTGCVDGYRESLAPKCSHCAKALVGSYCKLGGAELHQECVAPYREATAPKCPECLQSVTGSHYPYKAHETLSKTEEKVHVECSAAYDRRVRMEESRGTIGRFQTSRNWG